MAIALEFIDFVVPRRIIEEKYPGAWAGCLRDHQTLLGATVWYDEHLFRDGAMNSADIATLVKRWEKIGFDTRETVNGEESWKDVCVVEGIFGGPTLPCSWIEIDFENRAAHLSGAKTGPIIGREDF